MFAEPDLQFRRQLFPFTEKDKNITASHASQNSFDRE